MIRQEKKVLKASSLLLSLGLILLLATDIQASPGATLYTQGGSVKVYQAPRLNRSEPALRNFFSCLIISPASLYVAWAREVRVPHRKRYLLKGLCLFRVTSRRRSPDCKWSAITPRADIGPRHVCFEG